MLAVTADQRGMYVATSGGMMPGSGQIWQVDLAGHRKLVTDKSWGNTKALVALTGHQAVPKVLPSSTSAPDSAELEAMHEQKRDESVDEIHAAERDLARLEKEENEAKRLVTQARERLLELRARA